MKVGFALACLGVLGLLGLAVGLIVLDALQSTMGSGGATVVAIVFLLPLAIPLLVSTLLLLSRRNWARVLQTVVSGVIVLAWLYEAVAIGTIHRSPLILLPTVLLLIASTILIWLPASHSFFRAPGDTLPDASAGL